MLFTSFQYIVFLCIVVLIVPRLPLKLRGYALLLASYYFYSFWSFKYVLLLIVVTLFNYYIVKLFDPDRKDLRILFIAIFCNIAILVYFKYTNFLLGTVTSIGEIFDLRLAETRYDIVLPVGISFYMFQVMGYLIDVYRGTVTAEKNIGKFALFVSFFPQLLAGPIERAGRLLAQLGKIRPPTREELIIACSFIGWGIFKKVVIAENIDSVVGYAFSDSTPGGLITTIVSLYSFSIEVYCDFSAYSDIAVGTALLLGVRLTINFRDPYFATSIREYWTKWHISLTSWFRDYVYYPICFNRKLRISPVTGIILVFALSGFWHGASWTFVAWGIYWGVLLALEAKLGLEKKLSNTPVAQWIRRVILFNLVALSWVLFRADSFSQSWDVVMRLSDWSIYEHDLYNAKVLLICSLPLVISFCSRFRGWTDYRESSLRVLMWGVVGWFGLIVTIIFGADETREFIYFQF